MVCDMPAARIELQVVVEVQRQDALTTIRARARGAALDFLDLE
jgi:hypothetical protein